MPSKGPSFFTRFSRTTSSLAGRPATFVIVVLVILAWAVSGPLFGFSEAWQLTINTLTTIVTFLMVFLIQATQNRDSEAIQIKLDELIVALDGASDALLDTENLDEKELVELHQRYLALAEKARSTLKDRGRPASEPGSRHRTA